MKNLKQTLLKEPLEGFRLNLHQIWKIKHMFCLGEAHSHVLAELLLFNIDH